MRGVKSGEGGRGVPTKDRKKEKDKQRMFFFLKKQSRHVNIISKEPHFFRPTASDNIHPLRNTAYTALVTWTGKT